MPSDWPTATLGELTLNLDTRRKPVKETDRRAGPYPYYGASGIVDHVEGYLFEGEHLLIAEDGENLRTRNTPVAFRATGRFWVNNHAHIVTGNERARTRFLEYAVLAADLTPYLTGAVMPKLTQGNLNKIQIPCPSLSEQDAVIGVLGALDDRIDLLRQTNATLESIAQALFKSWFIDFDPVRAKAEGREPEGMDAAKAALFPAEFEESALGLIPKGWTVRSLDSFATYLNGLALQKYPAESEDEYLPVIKIAQLRAGHTNGSDRASARLKPEYVVRDGDVLFSWSGSLEVELWCGGEGALNQHLFKVTSSEVPKWFYYLATKHFLPGFRETAAHKATTMGHIQRGHLTASRLALPPAPVMRALSSVMGPLLERRISGALQARELAAVRDSLLPRLVSGRLRLPEAVEATEAAAA